MTKGLNYDQFDPELDQRRAYVRKKLMHVNQLADKESINKALSKLFADAGKNLFIETGIEFDYGFNIHIGDYFYANYHLTLLDTCPITIGNHCYFGPDVGLYTPVHPLDPEKRKADVELGKPITIGNNVWMGGHVTILPGVTLGDNVVVGAGSVVTKSFGDNVVLVGSPARVIKTVK
ncbi:sugar O-acetyltransferase [Philodulcilactobacillus myokoensis]|nr:sugar O-acetyltransferase [Philodulcilactobacillus myokoensis]